MLKQITIACFLLGFAQASYSQAPNIQINTIRWNATGFMDLLANVTAEGPCQFVTHGVQRVDWAQANGNFVISFTSTSISGSWEDLSTNGSLTLGLAGDSLTGQVVLSRTDEGIKAELTINGGSVPIKNSYTISSIEQL